MCTALLALSIGCLRMWWVNFRQPKSGYSPVSACAAELLPEADTASYREQREWKRYPNSNYSQEARFDEKSIDEQKPRQDENRIRHADEKL